MDFVLEKHRLKKLGCVILFFVNILFVFSNETKQKDEINELKYILSLDVSYAMIALQHSGLGLGINFEYKITDFLSAKYQFGQIVCFSDITIVTIDQQLFMYYYPLKDGLNKLYIGLGHGGNLFMYPNYPNKGNAGNDAAISITPILGWKWKALRYLMLDPFIGWQFNVLITNNYENFNEYLSNGLQWGINFKILLPIKND